MSWILLIAAGLFEVAFTASLSNLKNNSNDKILWIACMVASMALSLFLLYKATESIPVGTAYAVWTGIGAAGTVIAGILFFNEQSDFMRLFFITTLIISIAGLKITETG